MPFVAIVVNYRKTMSSNKRRKASIEVDDDDDEGGEAKGARGQLLLLFLRHHEHVHLISSILSTHEPLFICISITQYAS